tara:strand:- start:6488 stop:6619 length:132 start_codon:yes stop_codon:yes gene_type:complete
MANAAQAKVVMQNEMKAHSLHLFLFHEIEKKVQATAYIRLNRD